MITLRDLFDNPEFPELEIMDIMSDSRVKKEKSIFFSLQGLTHDGHQFISQAIDNGAICIVHSRELKNKKEGVFYVFDPLLTDHFPDYVNRFFDYPSSKLDVVGITGTNGKTTVSVLIQYLLNQHKKTSYIGTLGIYTNEFQLPSPLTTNTLVDNQRILSELVKYGYSVCSMEASSQGLDLGRVEGIVYESAIFTNLSQDHLDYHLNMESYYQAKKKLFSSLDYLKRVIINIDDEYGLRLSKELVNPVISVSSEDPSATAYIHNVEMSLDNVNFDLKIDNEVFHLQSNMVGKFNLVNLVQAMMFCVMQGMTIHELAPLIKAIPEIDGRFQRIESDEDFDVIIDFAHSPDSMEKILEFARSIVKEEGRVIAVFGSAGRRDRTKRKPMGQVADKYCDLIYLTADDPRDEVVSDIIEEIASGIFNHPYVKIESRPMAIHFAIHTARKNDIIIIMGKGPEDTIAIGNQDLPYDGDYNIAVESLKLLRKERDEEY